MTDDELLNPRPLEPNEALRAGLLDQTRGFVSRSAPMRTFGRYGICVTCFAIGLAVAWFRPMPEPRIKYVEVRVEVPVPIAEPSAPSPTPTPTASDLELQAEQTTVRAEAARKYRDAGHRYYRDIADYVSAIRCYRLFLDAADPADLAIGSDDTTLLVSLKTARESEKNP